MIAVGNRVRVLGKHGNQSGLGTVIGMTAKDRSHCSRTTKGRPLAVVKIDHDITVRLPINRLRKIKVNSPTANLE